MKCFSCKEYQNLNAFCAIVMGLSNVAVSRLSLTWEKVPSKARKMFTEFESLIDPSRNHRAYRIVVGKLQAPVVPFMPLLLKGMYNVYIIMNIKFLPHCRKSMFLRLNLSYKTITYYCN
jgi:hypothetical protein